MCISSCPELEKRPGLRPGTRGRLWRWKAYERVNGRLACWYRVALPVEQRYTQLTRRGSEGIHVHCFATRKDLLRWKRADVSSLEEQGLVVVRIRGTIVRAGRYGGGPVSLVVSNHEIHPEDWAGLVGEGLVEAEKVGKVKQ